MARVCEFFGNGPPVETKVATSHPASPAPMLLKLNLGSSKDLVAGRAQPKTQAIKTTANRQNLAFISDSPPKLMYPLPYLKEKNHKQGRSLLRVPCSVLLSPPSAVYPLHLSS